MQAFTLVLVYHEDPTAGAVAMASVWIATSEREDPQLPKEDNGWFKLIGPVEFDTADKICSSLETFFQKNGVRVKSETVAD
ncbi:MAG TPA: hypothetical protein VMH87_01200 [Pseudomonadales bacterium]|nr:hypothetical protein [Pseudomonadales bacterium]